MGSRRIRPKKAVEYYKIICLLASLVLLLFSVLGDQFTGQPPVYGKMQRVFIGLSIVLFVFSVYISRDLFTRQFFAIIFINFTILFSTLLIIDNLMYRWAGSLPANLVKYMSFTAQLRYLEKNPDQSPYHYDDHIFYYRSNYQSMNQLGEVLEKDELGYNNPTGYLKNNIDILLLGDSFTEGASPDRTIASYLRNKLAPYTVYSMGIGGQGIYHWKYHYQRFLEASFSPPPKNYSLKLL